jgi:hypothetical protein
MSYFQITGFTDGSTTLPLTGMSNNSVTLPLYSGFAVGNYTTLYFESNTASTTPYSISIRKDDVEVANSGSITSGYLFTTSVPFDEINDTSGYTVYIECDSNITFQLLRFGITQYQQQNFLLPGSSWEAYYTSTDLLQTSDDGDSTTSTGCQTSTARLINTPRYFVSADISSSYVNSPNGATISIAVNPALTQLTFTYSLDGVTFQSSPVFSGILEGDYTITVKDQLGCTASIPITIPAFTDGGVGERTPYADLPSKSNSIRYAKYIDWGVCSDYKNDENTCIFCGSSFSTFAHKRRHELHRCKDKDAVKHRKKITHGLEIKELKKEHKKLVETLLSKVGNTNIITTTNNLNLNSYGNEDISHITDQFKTQMLNMPYQMIPKMIEHVHFNEDKPENKNILIPNIKENKIKIFSNNKWIYRKKDDVLNDLIDGKYFMIDTHYETICNKIKNKRYEKFRTKYDKGDKSIIEQIKSESELAILNNR